MRLEELVMTPTPQSIADATDPKVCRKCGAELTDENWYPSCQKKNDHICKACNYKRDQLWRKENPDKEKAGWTRRIRKLGYQPYNENKKCSSFLGVHVAERVLSHVFKNVERMPITNPGFDFICNKGKKIDVKSSCQHKPGKWAFSIKHNTIADYFLCLAFDNREDLNPLYAWLLPGSKFNHLTKASIRPSTIRKWDEYRLDISKISDCCDSLRSTKTRHQQHPDNTLQKQDKTVRTNWDLSIVSYLKAGLNPAKICTKMDIPKQTLQYHLNKLKQQGVIRKAGYGCWEVIDQPETAEKKIGTLKHVAKEVRTPSQANLHQFIQDSVRAHAFVFVLQVPKGMRNWNNQKRELYLRKNGIQYKHLHIAGEGQRIIVKDRKVWLLDRSIIIYDRASYLAGIARDTKSLAVHTHISIIKKVERLMNADFTINGDYRFRISRQHYALIKNALAKQYDKEGRKLEVRTDKGLWMVIDNSYNMNEAETVHPSTAMSDNKKVQDFFNGVKETAITPAYLMEMMHGIQSNQMAFAENMTSHIQAVRDLGKGVGEMTEVMKQFKEE